jgi:phage terminase small subunit
MATRKASKKAAKKSGTRKPTVKQEMFVENLLRNGGNATKAARDAGYKHPNKRGYENVIKSGVQERIQARIREAQINTNEVVGTLVSHMRGDFGDILLKDKFVQEVRALGLSHLLKEVEVTERILRREVLIEGEDEPQDVLERKYKIKIHDSQAAAKQLCNVFGLEKLPAPNPEAMRRMDEAVDRFIEKAAKKGITVTPEQARTKLMPFLQSHIVQ